MENQVDLVTRWALSERGSRAEAAILAALRDHVEPHSSLRDYSPDDTAKLVKTLKQRAREAEDIYRAARNGTSS